MTTNNSHGGNGADHIHNRNGSGADPDDPPFFKRIADEIDNPVTEPPRPGNGATLHDAAGVTFDDFYAHMAAHKYIYIPTREPWPGASVNARLPPVQVGVDEKGKPIMISAATWLDQNRPVEQITWAPGLPIVIANRLICEGGWIERNDVSCLNLYRPSLLKPGNPAEAGPWIAHVEKIYPEHAAHIICWFAQRVQRPARKAQPRPGARRVTRHRQRHADRTSQARRRAMECRRAITKAADRAVQRLCPVRNPKNLGSA